MLWLKNLWYNKFGGKNTPWVDATFAVGKFVVRGYNQAYVRLAESKVPAFVRKDWDETSLVAQFTLDPNKEYEEEPRLDVVHMGLERDGVAKVKLDWNSAFILHLQKNGIEGETEEEAVQLYLQMLTAKKFDEFHQEVDETFKDYPDVEEVEGLVTGGAGEQFDNTVGDNQGGYVRHTNRRTRTLDR